MGLTRGFDPMETAVTRMETAVIRMTAMTRPQEVRRKNVASGGVGTPEIWISQTVALTVVVGEGRH